MQEGTGHLEKKRIKKKRERRRIKTREYRARLSQNQFGDNFVEKDIIDP